MLLFSDPARLARIRVGVRDTSTFTVQVDVNIAGRWNMAEIALLPRRLAEWSGTPPTVVPAPALGVLPWCQPPSSWWWKPQDQPLPQATEYQEKPQEENDSFVYRSMLSVSRYSMGLKLTTRDPENFGFADSRRLPMARQVRCSHSLGIG